MYFEIVNTREFKVRKQGSLRWDGKESYQVQTSTEFVEGDLRLKEAERLARKLNIERGGKVLKILKKLSRLKMGDAEITWDNDTIEIKKEKSGYSFPDVQVLFPSIDF